MVRQEREVRYRTDYTLGSNLRIFQNIAVQDPRHNSDHYMVMGCLRGTYQREHSHHIFQRTGLPLRPPVFQTRTWVDKIFTKLRRAVPKPEKQAARHKLCIS